MEAARHSCEQSKEKKVAPKELIEICLTSAAQDIGAKQIVKFVPTPTPSPIPTLQSSAPASPSDTIPVFMMKSEIPPETENEILTIEGIAVDDHGIKEVNISIRKAETGAIIAVNRAQMTEERFKTEVQLEMGQNEIIIDAIDTIGQIRRQVFTVLRTPSEQTVAIVEARSTLTSMSETTADSTQQPRNVYAVVIGVGDYLDERIPDLRFTVNDALGMYDVLIDPQFGGIPEDNIQLLLDEDATTRNIRSAIGTWLKRQAREEDTVLIYYAGHGAPEGDDTYWVTYDADVDDLYATALSNNAISDMLERVESKRVLTFLDSCYSAATVNRTNRTRDIIVEAPLAKFTGEGRVIISASDGTQLSLEMEAYEHGVFTYYLLDGLKGNADGMTGEERDGIIEIEEIWNYVRNQVTETAKQQGNKQTPKFQGSLTAGFPLTFDRGYLEERERQRLQEIQEKQAKLQELFEQGKIEASLFDCAFQMVEIGESDGYIDGLLSGELSPKTFGRLFKCQN